MEVIIRSFRFTVNSEHGIDTQLEQNGNDSHDEVSDDRNDSDKQLGNERCLTLWTITCSVVFRFYDIMYVNESNGMEFLCCRGF